MKRKLSCIIVGTGGHSRAVISLLKKSKNYIIEGLIDVSSDFDLLVLSEISLLTSLFVSKFSSIKKSVYCPL